MTKEKFLSLFDAAIDAVMPEKVIPNFIQREGARLFVGTDVYDLEAYAHCYLCGAGKAADAMAPAAEVILGDYCSGGVVVSPEADTSAHCYDHCVGTHPLPTQSSVDGAAALYAIFEKATQNDLILFLLSGGASALIELPIPPITIDEFTATTKLLLENGYSIDEINTVRKHLSMIKGGRLAAATKAQVVVPVISDVIGDDLHTIASAPLYCDPSTFEDAVKLLEKKGLFASLPPSVQQVLQEGSRGGIAESPKKPLPHTEHLLIASNLQALEAAAKAAKANAIHAVVDTRPLMGDVNEGVAELLEAFHALKPGTLYLRGGECTVVVKGNGRGGRNSHIALMLMEHLKMATSYQLIVAGTDGIDGNSDAAGAYASDTLFREALQSDIDPYDYLARFDSNTFFEQLGGAIHTGYTRTNVMDVVMLYKGH